MPALEISSTDIRRRSAEGKSIRYLLPDAVAHYINSHSLYQTC
jgi:nicotinate-nucleotide adenylyltransferase